MKDDWLFSADVIGQALSSAGHDVSRLSTPFAAGLSALGNHQFAVNTVFNIILACSVLFLINVRYKGEGCLI